MLLSKARQNEIDEKVSSILMDLNMSYPEDKLENIIESYDGLKATEYDFREHSDEISGAVSYRDGNPRIFINKYLTPARKTFTLAHEFGHYVLHRGQELLRLDFVNYNGVNSATETEANYFAATLLMPRDKFIEVCNLLKDEHLVADYFGVSAAAVRNRKVWIRNNA